MIPHSRIAAVLAAVTALSAHAAGLSGFGAENAIEIEGGGTVDEAALGASFADMVAGTVKPSVAREAPQPTPEDVQETPPEEALEPVEQAAPVEPQQTAKPAPVKPVEVAKPAAVQPVAQRPVDQPAVVPIAAVTAPQDKPIEPVDLAMAPPPDAQITSAPLSEAVREPKVAKPVEVSKPLETEAPTEQEQEVLPADARLAAIRPVARPEQARPVKQKPRKTKPEQPKPSLAAKAGNSQQNAKKGTETGAKPKGAANASRATSNSKSGGNAAASNYAGVVKRKIHRARRKSVNVRGAARVTFRIADSGALASISISRSSGSNRLDKVALTQVRSAAPFPKPPAGARRQYSVEIKGK